MKLKNNLPQPLIKQLSNSYFVGRLATEDEAHLTPFMDSNISLIDSTDHLQFLIRCLSEFPEELMDYLERPDALLDGSTKSNRNRRFLNEKIDFLRLPYPDIVPKSKELLENKVILFQLEMANNHLYVDIIAIEDYPPADRYFAIPGPELKLSESVEDLQNKLTIEKRPITLKHYPNMFKGPELIIYKNLAYRVALESKSKNNPTTYFQDESQPVKVVSLTLEDFNDIVSIRYEDHLYFTSEQQLKKLTQMIESKGEALTEQVTSSDQLSGAPTKLSNFTQEESTYFPSDNTELDFLNHVITRAKLKYKMYYYKEDIYSFHISVKTNPLTVLGGMSGTGKSQLARIYGEALGLTQGEDMLFIPISPAYQEPSDILGYLNPQTATFHESDTGLVSLLIEAEKNPDKLYMVIFDEMNLSQVEHWFSPFLSLLENNGDKYLQIFNKNNEVVNAPYKPQVKLGQNLIFVGTVNFDETTKSFSDRLLDRTNVITPTKAPFIETVDYYQENQGNDDLNWEVEPISSTLFRKVWKEDTSNIGLHYLSENEIYILDRLHNLINDVDPQKGVSFRVALSIVDYMRNVPVDQNNQGLIPKSKLFDYQINQRILTKIKGIDTFARPLVGYYDGEQNYVEGKLAKLFKGDRAKLVSDFEISLKTLKNKAKELMMYGFTN